jgi:hypothetical protein
MDTNVILPDLQSAVLCEDVRCEFNGMQTLVGVINVIPAPTLPINYIRLCIWARWCSGAGKFRQKSRIVGIDEQQVIAQAEVEFVLKEMEGTRRMYIISAGCSSSNMDCIMSRSISKTNCSCDFHCR